MTHAFFDEHREAIDGAVWAELGILADRCGDAGDPLMEEALRLIIKERIFPRETLYLKGSVGKEEIRRIGWNWMKGKNPVGPVEEKVAHLAGMLCRERPGRPDKDTLIVNSTFTSLADAFWWLAIAMKVLASNPYLGSEDFDIKCLADRKEFVRKALAKPWPA